MGDSWEADAVVAAAAAAVAAAAAESRYARRGRGDVRGGRLMGHNREDSLPACRVLAGTGGSSRPAAAGLRWGRTCSGAQAVVAAIGTQGSGQQRSNWTMTLRAARTRWWEKAGRPGPPGPPGPLQGRPRSDAGPNEASDGVLPCEHGGHVPPRMSFRHAYQESWAAAVPGGLGALRARSGSCARWTPCARTGRSAPARRGPPPDPLARAVHSAPLVAAASPKHRSEKKANKAGSKKGAQKWDRASRRWARGKRTGPSKSVLPRLRMYGGAGTSSADRFRAALSRNAPTGGGGGRLASTGSSLVGETEERLRRAPPPGARAGGLAR